MRVRKTIPQKSLGRKEREINLKNAFKTSTNALELKKVLLVDDIYTTGVTMDEAAKVLWMAGAEEVHFLVLCTGNQIAERYFSETGFYVILKKRQRNH